MRNTIAQRDGIVQRGSWWKRKKSQNKYTPHSKEDLSTFFCPQGISWSTLFSVAEAFIVEGSLDPVPASVVVEM